MKTRSLIFSIGFALACAAWFGLAVPRAHAQTASANPPGKMSYQGFLTDGNGNPLGSDLPVNRVIVFRLYTAPTGGTLKWAEQQTVTIDKGFFTVQLGEGSIYLSEPTTDNLTSLFTGADASDRYLEITVKSTPSDLTVAPRVRLLTSPYAFLARNAVAIVSSTGDPLVKTFGSNVGVNLSGNPTTTLDVLGTVKATSFIGSGEGLTGLSAAALANQSITSGKIAPNAVGASEIATSAVSSDEIQDGSVGTVDLADSSVIGAKIAANAVTTTKIADNNITTAKIADNSITTAKIAPRAIGYDQIGLQSIQSGNIAADAVGASEIRANAVGNDEIADGSITAAKVASSVGVWTKSGVNHYVTGAEVGINTTGPDRPLHVTATTPTLNTGTGLNNYLCLRLEAGPRSDYWDIGLDDDSANSSDDGDLVFIYKSAQKGYLDATSGGWKIPSDRRLKTDIETLPRETLSSVMKIPAVRFRMIDQQKSAPKQIGIIAQDLQAFYPELVDDKHGMLSVSYDRIGVISMAAVQELKTEKDAEIRELKTENASLKQQMGQILERLQALEQKGR